MLRITREMIDNCLPCSGGWGRYTKALPWYEDWIRSNGRNLQQISDLIGNYVGDTYQHDPKSIRKTDFKWLFCQIIKNSSKSDYEFMINQITKVRAILVLYTDNYAPTPSWFDVVLAKCNRTVQCINDNHCAATIVWHMADVIHTLYFWLNRTPNYYIHENLKGTVNKLRGVTEMITNHPFNESYTRMSSGDNSTYGGLEKRLAIIE